MTPRATPAEPFSIILADCALRQTFATGRPVNRALERHGNDRLATARALGIHKSTLHHEIHALGLALPKGDDRSRTR